MDDVDRNQALEQIADCFTVCYDNWEEEALAAARALWATYGDHIDINTHMKYNHQTVLTVACDAIPRGTVNCNDGDVALVRWLVEEARADVNVTNAFGVAPFYLACANGKHAIARYLLARGADPRAVTGHRRSALWGASLYGESEIVRWLIRDARLGDLIVKDVLTVCSYAHSRILKPELRARRAAIARFLRACLVQRFLIAHWGDGRKRRRRDLLSRGIGREVNVWCGLPRPAFAEVLLLLIPATVDE